MASKMAFEGLKLRYPNTTAFVLAGRCGLDWFTKDGDDRAFRKVAFSICQFQQAGERNTMLKILGRLRLDPGSLCRHCRRHCSRFLPSLDGAVDKYNGVTVDLGTIPLEITETQFHEALSKSMLEWRSNDRSAVWLRVPILHSKYIPVAAREGFQYHHAEHGDALLKLWLREGQMDATPRFATHQVGVSGMVIKEETGEVLVVKDRNSQFNLWKFPGGLSDLGEDIGDTAVREVFEETGIKSEFVSILALRQQHNQPGAWGRSDIFIMCLLRPLSYDIDFCHHEIKACEWMKIADLRKETNVSSITFRLTSIALYGLEEGFNNVSITQEEMKSVYKGLKYRLYHRPLPANWM